MKIITLLVHGCPRQAVVAAFEVDERTVKSLEENAGQHCQEVHEHLVEQPRDLGHVQADEIRAAGTLRSSEDAPQMLQRLSLLNGVLDHG